MKILILKAPIVILTFSLMSCVSLTEEQEAYAGEVTEYKSPAKAVGLALLPGVSNLYLASEKDKPSSQKSHTLGLMGIINWATWPVSPLWAIPQAYIDANRINVQESSYLEKKCRVNGVSYDYR